MPYVFAFLVVANAVFMGYELLKKQQPESVQVIAIESQYQFPQRLELVPIQAEPSH